MHPIGVKLASHRVTDVGFSFSSWVGETAMDIGAGAQQCVECQRADDGENEQQQVGVLHPPERRRIGGVEQFLRGEDSRTSWLRSSHNRAMMRWV
jgi:hypothetical protein